MSGKFFIGCALAALAVFSVAAVAEAEDASSGHGAWLTDYDQALKEAKEKKLPILADFSGSDWCGWCVKLDQEVFSKKEFLDYAKKHFVLLLVDFPRTKKMSANQKKQNEELAKKYSVRGFPTVLLLDDSGKQLAQGGYQPGGPEKYIEYLKKLLADAK